VTYIRASNEVWVLQDRLAEMDNRTTLEYCNDSIKILGDCINDIARFLKEREDD